MTNKDKIIVRLRSNGEQTVHELTAWLGISRQRVHRIIKELLADGNIQKSGTAPKVYYSLKQESPRTESIEYSKEDIELLRGNWMLVDPLGSILTGETAFEKWCTIRNLPVKKTIDEYRKTKLKYDSFVGPDLLIDGTSKLIHTKELDVCIDQQFYADFYAIERFGKTKLGQLLHFGKMSQSIKLIKEIVELTRDRLERLIQSKRIEAVAYIPPTLKRDIQIMKQLELMYNLSLPKLKLEKVTGEIIIPQKALSKIRDRIQNATNSISIKDKRQFESILLIDDALGSGATINQTACKLKEFGQIKTVYGFAITGSYKGFEVLSEA